MGVPYKQAAAICGYALLRTTEWNLLPFSLINSWRQCLLQKHIKQNTTFPSGCPIVTDVFYVMMYKNARVLQCEGLLSPSWTSTEMYSLDFAETELPCHQLTTMFLDIKIKLTQKIFLNRAQWLNWRCYKYYGTKVYFCLYFSLPDTVKPTVNTQTFLLLLLSRRVCGFFRAILNSVPHFI